MNTPDEARMLWCPMTRMLTHISAQDGKGRTFEGGYSYNRSPDDGQGYVPCGSYCVADKCGMWRWAQKPNPAWKPDNGMMSTFGRDTRNDPPMYIADETRGYCGLAGRAA